MGGATLNSQRKKRVAAAKAKHSKENSTKLVVQQLSPVKSDVKQVQGSNGGTKRKVGVEMQC